LKTIMVTFGTRPESIKMCPVVLELKKRANVKTVVCVSGQHREMLDQVLAVFEVEPDYDLSVMQSGQTLFEITQLILGGMKAVLETVKPDIVLVHGDTTTAFAAALACFYLAIPVGHVEAGLRTHNMKSPFPEEFNRQCVGLIASLHFAPTRAAADNLIIEGKDVNTVHVTGNTSIDALRTTVQNGYQHEQLKWVGESRLILLTAHRRENIGIPLDNMLRAVIRIVNTVENVKVIYPVHRNPAVQKAANEILGGHDRIHLIDPLNVLEFHNIMAASFFILTDSGGIQEEAPSLGKPVLVMRDTTERPEGVAAGTLRLVGTNEEDIYQAAHLILSDQKEYQKMSAVANPYGDGSASEQIVDILLR
jgi:UDP-N-acetylglucosamine 2-epimerase (non-hydrolysing)